MYVHSGLTPQRVDWPLMGGGSDRQPQVEV